MSFVLSLESLDTSHVSTQVLHGERGILFLESSDKLIQISVEPVNLGCAGKALGANLDLILQLSPRGSEKIRKQSVSYSVIVQVKVVRKRTVVDD